MDYSFLSLVLPLLEKACVVVVAAYLISHSRYFQRILEQRSDFKDTLIIMTAFGLVAIYGTYSGIPMNGAVANVRNIGPVIAGLVGGPLVGLGAGLIGGIDRYLVGGTTGMSCSITTVLAGLIGGAVYILNKKKFIGIPYTVLLSIGVVILDMGMALLIARPFEDARTIVENIALPMIVANAVAAAIFSFIIENMMQEKAMVRERDEYRGELERKSTELKIARDIQLSFLPDSVPVIRGYDLSALSLPASEVGGDFYDFIDLPGGRLGLAIADVAGKSVPAALYMALSRAVLRSSVDGGQNVAASIKKANELITRDSRSGLFVTLFYAVLDGHTLTYVNAGHNPPFLVREMDIRLMDRNGIAIGAVEDASYEDTTISLESGDVVVFYTDGVTEAIDGSGNQFGEQRLFDVARSNRGLSAEEITRGIRSEVLSFCGGTLQSDDITLIVIKVL
jgi:sigma-B regulation protein RsbU (phosphoserine phosphatase)